MLKTKREELTIDNEKEILGEEKEWSEWEEIYKIKTNQLNFSGLYEQCVNIEGNRIIMYLGMNNTTLGERISSYKINGSHLKHFYEQFKKHEIKIELRWKRRGYVSTRLKSENNRIKEEESTILSKIDYILNSQENNVRRIDDFNVLIKKYCNKEIIILDKIKKSKETLLKEKLDILSIEKKETKKEDVKDTNFIKISYYNKKNVLIERTVNKEGWVITRAGEKDKRYKKPFDLKKEIVCLN